MNRFKVKSGMHIEGGTRYKKGDIVVSPLPLIEMFREKFEPLGPAEAKKIAEKVEKPAAPARKATKTVDEWEAEKAAAAK